MTPGSIQRVFGALLIGAVVSVFAGHAHAQSKIAVVDTQGAIMETEDGLRAQATLKKLFDSRQRELDKKQSDLQKQRQDIEKQRGLVSKAVLQKRMETWQHDMVRLQTVFVEYNKELRKKQNELTQPIFQRTMGIIRRLASQEGYDIVVDKQAVPYVRSDLDLTDRVVQMYNQGAGESSTSTSGDKGKQQPAPKALVPSKGKK